MLIIIFSSQETRIPCRGVELSVAYVSMQGSVYFWQLLEAWENVALLEVWTNISLTSRWFWKKSDPLRVYLFGSRLE